MKLFSIFKNVLPFICTILLGVSIHAQDSGADEITDIGNAKSFDTPIGYPTPPGSGGALSFDGTNDLIISSSGNNLNPGQGSFSLSTWIKVFSSPNQWHHIVHKYGLGGVNGGPGGIENDTYALGLFSDGQIRFTIRDESGNIQFIETEKSIQDSGWHHVAAVLDRNIDSVSVFIDGYREVKQPLVVPGNISPQNNLTIAGAENWQSNGYQSFLNALIDEIRIWKGVALTQEEVRDYMCKKDLSDHPQISHLAAYYRFDDSTGSGQLKDLSGNGNDGTLINMNPTNDWVISGAPIGDVSVHAESDSFFSLDIGNSFSVSDLSEDIELVHLYRVDEAPNNTAVPSAFNSLLTDGYWGVFAVGGENPSFTVEYDYENNPNVNNQPDELSVRYGYREGNASGGFGNITNQLVNEVTNTLSADNKTNGEYILGFGDFECPTLGGDIGNSCNDGDSSTENDSINANCECEGEFVCANPFPAVDEASLSTTFTGNSYLTAWDAVANQIGCQVAVRFAGGNLLGQVIVPGVNASSFNIPGGVLSLNTSYEWRVRCGCSQSPIVAGPWSSWQPFTTPGGASIISSPNPTEGISQVSFSVAEPQRATLEVMDMNGRVIEMLFSGMADLNSDYRFEFDGSGLPSGVYLYRLSTEREVVTEKVLITQ